MTQKIINQEEFFDKASKLYSPEEFKQIEKAFYFAQEAHKNQVRKSGEAYFVHPLNVAKILMDLLMDTPTVIAGLLHDVVEDTEYTSEDVTNLFGKEVSVLVAGVTKLDKLKFESKSQAQAENLRKLLLAMAKDLRVIVIKFADRLHNMRTLDSVEPEKQIFTAKETLEIYAPLAARLGIGQVKGELEDLSMRYLYPEDYYKLVSLINAKKEERDRFVKEISEVLKKKLDDLGIVYEINGRSKHFYSIFKKMRRQGVGLDGIYDLLAIRIIVPDKKDCYNVLGIAHSMWAPLPYRFKDYIATPKPNNYQSLHTTVMYTREGEDEKEGIPFEIQIRTKEMHLTAEYGIAAHWKYKDGTTDKSLDMKIAWIREVMELSTSESSINSREYMSSLKMDIFSDEIFVFTPAGDVLCLPIDSTPIDFAYSIHTNVGHRCVGAKVNNRMVPLSSKLKTGDIVEIITSNSTKGPSRDWLRIIKTAGARSKIRQYFKKTAREENIKIGRDMLEGECKRKNCTAKDILIDEWLKEIATRQGCNTVEDLYSAIGCGEINTSQVIPKLIAKRRAYLKANAPQKVEEVEQKPKKRAGSGNILINGESGMLVKLAKCCSPVPGDNILGYISRGRGITVHRADCQNINNSEDERRIKAEWADVIAGKFIASLAVLVNDVGGIVADILTMISGLNINVCSLHANSHKDGSATVNMSLELASKEDLEGVMRKIKNFRHVMSVTRV